MKSILDSNFEGVIFVDRNGIARYFNVAGVEERLSSILRQGKTADCLAESARSWTGGGREFYDGGTLPSSRRSDQLSGACPMVRHSGENTPSGRL